MPKVNWSQVEDFQALPAGEYACRLSGAEYVEESKSSGQPYYALTFTVDEGQYQNRKLFKNQSMSPDALPFMKQTLKALGQEQLSDDDDLDVVFAQLVGNECRLKVSQREYQGEMRNNVDRVLAPAYAA